MFDEREERMQRKNNGHRRDGDMFEREETFIEKVERFERKARYLIWGK